jgi:hypothetical protein
MSHDMQKHLTRKTLDRTGSKDEKLRDLDEIIIESDLKIIKRILKAKNVTCNQNFKAYKTVIVNPKTYHSYNRSQKTFDSLVKLKDNRFGFIHANNAEGKRSSVSFEEKKLTSFFYLRIWDCQISCHKSKIIESKMIYIDTDQSEYCFG